MTTLAPLFLIGSSLFLQVTRTTIKSRMGLKFSKIGSGTYELAALERLVPSFLDGSSSFLQITRPTIKARMSLNFS